MSLLAGSENGWDSKGIEKGCRWSILPGGVACLKADIKGYYREDVMGLSAWK